MALGLEHDYWYVGTTFRVCLWDYVYNVLG